MEMVSSRIMTSSHVHLPVRDVRRCTAEFAAGRWGGARLLRLPDRRTLGTDTGASSIGDPLKNDRRRSCSSHNGSCSMAPYSLVRPKYPTFRVIGRSNHVILHCWGVIMHCANKGVSMASCDGE